MYLFGVSLVYIVLVAYFATLILIKPRLYGKFFCSKFNKKLFFLPKCNAVFIKQIKLHVVVIIDNGNVYRYPSKAWDYILATPTVLVWQFVNPVRLFCGIVLSRRCKKNEPKKLLFRPRLYQYFNRICE